MGRNLCGLALVGDCRTSLFHLGRFDGASRAPFCLDMRELDDKITTLIARLYGWPDGTAWLLEPNERLAGASPWELMRAGREAEVLGVLEMLAAGAPIQ